LYRYSAGVCRAWKEALGPGLHPGIVHCVRLITLATDDRCKAEDYPYAFDEILKPFRVPKKNSTSTVELAGIHEYIELAGARVADKRRLAMWASVSGGVANKPSCLRYFLPLLACESSPCHAFMRDCIVRSIVKWGGERRARTLL
jgi:hypothetical protein